MDSIYFIVLQGIVLSFCCQLYYHVSTKLSFEYTRILTQIKPYIFNLFINCLANNNAI